MVLAVGDEHDILELFLLAVKHLVKNQADGITYQGAPPGNTVS